jgi:ABC-2 type transport system ATP-binding protein
VHEPEVILLDEPTTGVDPVSRREFWKLLSEFLAGGLTILMATPYLDEAERCARVAMLHEGRLLAVDAPKALQQAFSGDLYEVLAQPHRAAYEALAGASGIADRQTFGDRIHVRAASSAVDEAAIRRPLEAANIRVIGIRRVIPSLEDVFIDRVRQS